MCCVTVVQCKCPSYVGLEGILLQETANTAVIVTRTHGFKSTSRRAPVRAVVDPPFRNATSAAIPKTGCVFRFTVGKHAVTLYGSQLLFKAADRATRKYKSRATIEL